MVLEAFIKLDLSAFGWIIENRFSAHTPRCHDFELANKSLSFGCIMEYVSDVWAVSRFELDVHDCLDPR